jgi:hypothetical protein
MDVFDSSHNFFLTKIFFFCRLDEFKKLNPSGNLDKDTELLMTIRGDTLLYKNALGNVGTIQSEVFTKAMCDVYFGDSPASPPAKARTIEAIKKL